MMTMLYLKIKNYLKMIDKVHIANYLKNFIKHNYTIIKQSTGNLLN